MDLYGSPNLREGLKIIPSDSSSRVIFNSFRGLWLLPFSSSRGGFHSCHGSEAYGPFYLAPTDFILVQVGRQFFGIKNWLVGSQTYLRWVHFNMP